MTRQNRTNRQSIDHEVGRRLAEARSVRKLTPAGLATQAGLSTEEIVDSEAGRKRLGAGQLHDLAQALGVSVAYFFENLSDVALISPKHVTRTRQLDDSAP